MTPEVRVALLDAARGAHSRELAHALHGAELVVPARFAPGEALLRRRGFSPGLTALPAAVGALARGGFHIAHAFTAFDAAAALAWRRMTGRPVVYTCAGPLARNTLSDRRLRLWSLRCALEESDALVAADEEVCTSVERWFALRAQIMAASDASGHDRLYRNLLGADQP